MAKTKIRFWRWFLSFAFASTALASVKLNPLFSDGAVLQQGIMVPVWGTAKDGEKVTVEFDGDKEEATANAGKWMVHLKPHKAGGPFALKLVTIENEVTINNVLVGEVWVCSGQSNMSFQVHLASNAATEEPVAVYPKLRMFHVANKTALEPQGEAGGSWQECNPKTVGDFSAVGYFFGRDIHKATGVPVGLIHASWGGTMAQAWTSLSGLEKDKELEGYVTALRQVVDNYPHACAKAPQELADYQTAIKKGDEEVGTDFNLKLNRWPEEKGKAQAEGKALPPRPQPTRPKPSPPLGPEGGNRTPTVLYNGMIAPLIPYGMRGVIWYQGEGNAGKAREYCTLFPRLIADWREKWGLGEFPFLFVQVAPYKDMPPEIREAQLLTWKKTVHTAMAVTTDVGEAADIHPKQKEPVGARLALAARVLIYGEKLEYSGPVFDSMKVETGMAILHFQHTGSGLMAKDGELRGFTVAGADKQFVPAKAEIRGDTVAVSNTNVSTPAVVRFGWANVPEVNLYNKEGLPASPFRTDSPASNH